MIVLVVVLLLSVHVETVNGAETRICDQRDLGSLFVRLNTVMTEINDNIRNLKETMYSSNTALSKQLEETILRIEYLNVTMGVIKTNIEMINRIIETDECASNPCINNATCLDGLNRYSCKCGSGYSGSQCQMNIDECASSPCQNGATCNDQVNGFLCTCSSDWTGIYCEQVMNVSDCIDIRRNGFKTTGVYNVILRNTRSLIQVFCDMSTDNGGWTVFQNRFDGSVDFYQNFSTYEWGFGDLNGEFWLGLKYIQEMTAGSPTELRIDLTAANGTTAYEVFQNFNLTAGPYYRLNIDPGTGTAGDTEGLSYSKGYAFSTFDRDVDSWSDNCAVLDHGGWWYSDCAFANLNGEYITPGTVSAGHSGERGMTYRDFQGYQSLKTSKMMFRRV